MKKELITHRIPKSPISEIFRTLRTNIQFMNQSKMSHVILVTSTNASEGKSFVAANLAISFAQAEKKVLLIDCDLRKGRVHRLFKMFNNNGIAINGMNKATGII